MFSQVVPFLPGKGDGWVIRQVCLQLPAFFLCPDHSAALPVASLPCRPELQLGCEHFQALIKAFRSLPKTLKQSSPGPNSLNSHINSTPTPSLQTDLGGTPVLLSVPKICYLSHLS